METNRERRIIRLTLTEILDRRRRSARQDFAKFAVMRGETSRVKLERFMAELGTRAEGPGTVYLTGGATALLYGWRDATIDVDIKPDPEPAGILRAIEDVHSMAQRADLQQGIA
jgi:hypothetical protein